MTTGFYPGSFNPLTLGHEHIIKVAASVFDKLVVGVGVNADKVYSFSVEERVEMVQEAVAINRLTNVEVIGYDGLLVQAAAKVGAKVIVRGLRTTSDFDYEFTLNDFNKTYDPDLETMFLMAPKEFLTISSTNVRTAVKAGLPVHQWVNPTVAQYLLRANKKD